jgi:hypothetical protein
MSRTINVQMKNIFIAFLMTLCAPSFAQVWPINIRINPNQDPDIFRVLASKTTTPGKGTSHFVDMPTLADSLEQYLSISGDTNEAWLTLADALPEIDDTIYHAGVTMITLGAFTNDNWSGQFNVEGRIHPRYPFGNCNNIAIGGFTGNGTMLPTGYNIMIGDSAMYSGSSSTVRNIAIGRGSLFSSSGVFNTAIGFETMRGGSGSTFGSTGNSSAFGYQAGRQSTTSAINNTLIGSQAGYTNTAGDNNTFLGYQSGRLSTGSRNVFLGSEAGETETGDDLLYIDNSNTSSPLLKGDFAANTIDINGLLSVDGDIRPLTDDARYIGKNDDDSPKAFKGIILKDQVTGTYYRIEIISGAIVLTDLTD